MSNEVTSMNGNVIRSSGPVAVLRGAASWLRVFAKIAFRFCEMHPIVCVDSAVIDS